MNLPAVLLDLIVSWMSQEVCDECHIFVPRSIGCLVCNNRRIRDRMSDVLYVLEQTALVDHKGIVSTFSQNDREVAAEIMRLHGVSFVRMAWKEKKPRCLEPGTVLIVNKFGIQLQKSELSEEEESESSKEEVAGYWTSSSSGSDVEYHPHESDLDEEDEGDEEVDEDVDEDKGDEEGNEDE